VETSERLNFARKLGARAHAELGVNVRQMAGHGPFPEEKGGGDLGIRTTPGNQEGDTPFGGGQPALARAAADPPEAPRASRPQVLPPLR